MREISIRPRAQLDIESAYVYRAFELKQPQSAQNLVDALYASLEHLAELPEMGTSFACTDLEQPYHRFLVKNYWIYYTFTDSSLVVWRVFHARQDIENYGIVDINSERDE